MDASLASVCDDLTILLNTTLVKEEGARWLAECRKYRDGYEPSVRWEQNKTLIYKYRESTARVLGLDVLLTDAVLVVPLGTDLLRGGLLGQVVDYLTATIKCICPVAVANEMGFRLSVYVPLTHDECGALRQCEWLTVYNNPWTISTLGDDMGGPMNRFELVFKFDNSWNLVKNTRVVTNEPYQLGPCFRPPPPVASSGFVAPPFGSGVIRNPNPFFRM